MFIILIISFDLVKKLNFITIDSSFTLLSLDVISLFTNVPLDLAVRNLQNRWKFIKENTTIPQKEFISAVSLVLSSMFFSFNDKIYKNI